jgi:DNA excision repair protein ERCC-2
MTCRQSAILLDCAKATIAHLQVSNSTLTLKYRPKFADHMQSVLFPHETVRDQQDQLISGVLEAIDKKGQLVVHAPTGLGKTAAALAPAIERAITLNKVVIFMTSRLTQHALALETVSKIRQRHNVYIPVVDLVGKKHMCLQPGVERLSSREFSEYCKSMREDGLCEYFTRLKTGEQMSGAAKDVLIQLGKTAPNSPEQVKMLCQEEDHKLCPYEITVLLAKDARVIITDYSYIFNESIRDGLLKRINRELADCILVIDEGHNLPERVKDLATERITPMTIRRAAGELQKFQREDHKHHLQQLQELLMRLGERMQDERHVSKEEFMEPLRNICPPEQLIDDLEEVAQLVREDQKASSCGAIADFLTAWDGEDVGFTRILSRNERIRQEEEKPQEEQQHSLFGKKIEMPSAAKPVIPLDMRYRCLDPAVITKPVFDAAYSTIIMSGTLTPTDMYAQLLGTTAPKQLTLASPFPQENRLNIIIPKTTTKFTTRSVQMFDEMAAICAKATNAVPGNCAIFFPSYSILADVKRTFETLTKHTVFTEHPSFTKEEREELLQRFKSYKHTGAVLLGVMGGSFSEGIDLPGDELRTVIIVGLPLSRPDLETKALIDYYQAKFGKGWEYGYTYPAFNKTLQSAGRCIRTESDRGAIIFLDERYAWQNYYACFPQEWHIRVSLRYEDQLHQFFKVG